LRRPVDGGAQAISKCVLTLRGNVPGMSEAQFIELANKAKAGCPVSKALGAVEITLDAKLEG
jgi:osmotically inducible protein OsmC